MNADPQSALPPDRELSFQYSRAGGPGGQHVNRTETRVTVRWNLERSTVISPIQRERIRTALQRYLTLEGEFVLHEDGSRSRALNEEVVVSRLRELVRQALIPPKRRKKSCVGRGQREARLEGKRRRSQTKAGRRYRGE